MSVTIKILNGILWFLIISLSIYFFFDNVITYFFGYRSNLFGDTFFHNQIWVSLHMAGGTLILLIGPIQFWNWFRNKFLHIHRLLGKIYLLGACIAGFSALGFSLINLSCGE